MPLLPLTGEGQQHETIDKMVDGIVASEQFNLLSLGHMFAGLVFKDKADREWLKRRFAVYKDILEESWVYQEILEKGLEKGLEQGLEKGLEQGLEKGLEQGLEKGLRQALMAVVQGRFPQMVGLTRKLTDDVVDPEKLQRLIVGISIAKDMQEAQKTLIEMCVNQAENQ